MRCVPPCTGKGDEQACVKRGGVPQRDWALQQNHVLEKRLFGGDVPKGRAGVLIGSQTSLFAMGRFFRRTCTAVLVSVVVFTGLGFGCSTGAQPEEGETEYLVADVDSLGVPAHIAPSDTLSVHIVGTVGPNGCYSLDRIEEERSEGQLTLTPVVRHVTDRMCTMALVPLEETYEVAPPFEEGTLQVVVPQTEEADVTATVDVKE